MDSRYAPGPCHLRTRLDNGLELVLLHRPGQSKAAAILQTHAGSHDAPPCVDLIHHLHDFLQGSGLYAGKQIGGVFTWLAERLPS